ISGEEKDFVFLIPQYEKDRLVSSEALSLLAVIVRDALAKSYRAPVVSDEEESGGLSERFSCEKLMKIMRICTDAKQAIDSNIKIGLAAAVMFCDISALKDL
ncbi:MAG: hypothetical protein ACI4QV_02345, partial [Acutalibacteraceae bacterium]